MEHLKVGRGECLRVGAVRPLHLHTLRHEVMVGGGGLMRSMLLLRERER